MNAARRVLAALLVQGAFLLWLTWPLATSMATHRPARPLPVTNFDPPLLAWALAHETRALVGDPSSFAHGGIFHPTTHALYYGEPAFAALPFFAPVFLATENATLALNLTLLGGIVLSAAAVQLVVQRWTASLASGVLAGWVFLNVPWLLARWVTVAPNYGILFPLPLVMWLAADPGRATRRWPALLGLGIVQALASPYLAVAAAAPIGLLGAARLLRRSTRADGLVLVAVAGAIAVATGVAYQGPLALHAADPGLAMRSTWSFASDMPRDVTGAWVWRHQPANVSLLAVSCAALGFVLRCLGWGASTVAGRRAWAHALLWIALGLVASLPRVLVMDGRVYPGPWSWAGWIVPAANGIRQPIRLGVIALFGVVVAAGLGWSEISSALRRLAGRFPAGRRIAPALSAAAWVAIVVGVYVTNPERPTDAFELTEVPDERDTPVMQAIARLGGPVLELPLAGPPTHTEAMYRSIAHRQPLLNGYSGYWPATFAGRMQIACRLPDLGALRRLQAETGLALIVVNRREWSKRVRNPRWRVPPSACPESQLGKQRWKVWQFIADHGYPLLELVVQERNRLLFRVRMPPELPNRPVRDEAGRGGARVQGDEAPEPLGVPHEAILDDAHALERGVGDRGAVSPEALEGVEPELPAHRRDLAVDGREVEPETEPRVDVVERDVVEPLVEVDLLGAAVGREPEPPEVPHRRQALLA